jgi:hypothetical protein
VLPTTSQNASKEQSVCPVFFPKLCETANASLRHVATCFRSGNNKQNSNIAVMFYSGVRLPDDGNVCVCVETSSHSKAGDLQCINMSSLTHESIGACDSVVVEALYYTPEGPGFEIR